MGLIELVWLLLIGLIAGWLAGQIVKGRGFGIAVDMIVGVIGSFVGGFLFNLLGLATFTLIGRLIAALVGSIVLLYLIRIIRRA
jgi:uncharacterized membrane protein YeaQ/YmgE (transglycosylase-associated protein family)